MAPGPVAGQAPPRVRRNNALRGSRVTAPSSIIVVVVIAVFVSKIAVVVFGSGPVMVVIVVVVVVVAVFVRKIVVVVFGEGRPPNKLLSPFHPPNGEN